MDIQQIIVYLLGAISLYFVGRHVWAEVEGFVRPSKAGGCPGCGGCDAAKAEASKARPAPEMKKTPLVTVSPSRPVDLPEHLAHLRKAPKEPAVKPVENE
jgi:hypothetical protein